MSDETGGIFPADLTSILESIRQLVIQKMSPMALPADGSLVLNLTDNGGCALSTIYNITKFGISHYLSILDVDFWRFAEDDVELSSLFDSLIEKLVSPDVSTKNVDGSLMLMPQNDSRILYLVRNSCWTAICRCDR
jgi:hypothetical protein